MPSRWLDLSSPAPEELSTLVEAASARQTGGSAKGYRHLRPGVESRDWTDAEMTVTDPFGNRIRFGELPAAKDQCGGFDVPTSIRGEFIAVTSNPKPQ